MAHGAKSAYTADADGDSRPEREGESIDDRTRRALEQYLTVLDYGPASGAADLYMVVSESGSEYLVDVREGSCGCPDATHRDVECKHQKRVLFATGRRPIPAAMDRGDVDDQLGAHVDAEPEFAAAGESRALVTDGGVTTATGDDAVGDVLNDTDDRPADCLCHSGQQGLPCFHCFEAGFETPNPEPTATGGDD